MSVQPLSVLDLFRQTGAYLSGHFRLTSGLHSPEYLQSAKVLQYPAHAERLGQELAAALLELTGGQAIQVVVAPALGGLIIGHEVARALDARFVFTERDASGGMVMRRGFHADRKDSAVVVEDVITTGGSTRETIEIVRQGGAQVLAVGSIIERAGGRVDVGLPRIALATLEVISYKPDQCPLCRQGIEVAKPGSRPAP
ncbi:MAG: orotate phosphoribosyltransferase [Candidatus Solibacter usitatus]|nr:orotate phosphoribosyltransferase [Candidatus Solibacter usitatus]